MSNSYVSVQSPTLMSRTESCSLVKIFVFSFIARIIIIVSRDMFAPKQSNIALLLAVVVYIPIPKCVSCSFSMLTEQSCTRCTSALKSYLVRNKQAPCETSLSKRPAKRLSTADQG